MKYPFKLSILILALIIAIVPLLTACGGGDDDEEENGTTQPAATSGSGDDVTINIGNLSDFTGPTAKADEIINAALADVVKYYNDNDLIPGAKLEVIDYDSQYDPGKFVPGYKWLMERGADLIFTPVPGSPEILRTRLEEDGVIMFTPSADKKDLVPPGNIFLPTTIPQDGAYTIMKWIAENDPDFPTDRPAKIGAVGWSTPYNLALHEGAEEYADAHPDQYDWQGAYTSPPGTFTWTPEVEALKDCDYVMPPIHMGNYVREYRIAGHGAKFIGSGAQAAFLYLINDAHLWPEIDDMLFFGITAWWNDDTEAAQFMRDRLFENHSQTEAEEIMSDGSAYGAIDALNQMVEIIRNAVEAVGPENFSSEALYEAAISYEQVSDGVVRASYSDTKRAALDMLPVYEVDAEAKDLLMVSDGDIPLVREP